MGWFYPFRIQPKPKPPDYELGYQDGRRSTGYLEQYDHNRLRNLQDENKQLRRVVGALVWQLQRHGIVARVTRIELVADPIPIVEGHDVSTDELTMWVKQ